MSVAYTDRAIAASAALLQPKMTPIAYIAPATANYSTFADLAAATTAVNAANTKLNLLTAGLIAQGMMASS